MKFIKTREDAEKIKVGQQNGYGIIEVPSDSHKGTFIVVMTYHDIESAQKDAIGQAKQSGKYRLVAWLPQKGYFIIDSFEDYYNFFGPGSEGMLMSVHSASGEMKWSGVRDSTGTDLTYEQRHKDMLDRLDATNLRSTDILKALKQRDPQLSGDQLSLFWEELLTSDIIRMSIWHKLRSLNDAIRSATSYGQLERLFVNCLPDIRKDIDNIDACQKKLESYLEISRSEI